MNERRKQIETPGKAPAKATSLPADYLRMVQDVFTSSFAEGLNALKALQASPRFEVAGDLYADEVVLKASLLFDGQIAATTAYASSDFDPAANSPKLEEVLGNCVDALGAVFSHLLDPKNLERLEQLRGDSLAALEDIPFEWSRTEVNRRDVYIRVDKANPGLDKMADEWLAKNDPIARDGQSDEDSESEEMMSERVEQAQGDRNKRGGGPTYH